MTEIEFASDGHRGLSAYQGLAKWAGIPLEAVVDAAEKDQLGELVERRQRIRPRSGAEALRHLERVRYAPGAKPRSPHAAIGELRPEVHMGNRGPRARATPRPRCPAMPRRDPRQTNLSVALMAAKVNRRARCDRRMRNAATAIEWVCAIDIDDEDLGTVTEV